LKAYVINTLNTERSFRRWFREIDVILRMME